MKRFRVTNLPLAGLKLVERQRLGDNRGSLSRLFCRDELVAAGWVKPVAQINHAVTAMRGTVRGMHFQRPPHDEMKLVSCLRGEVWDVAVDVRAHSPTFLHWHAEHLSAENGRALLIPEGFAHGLQSLTDDVELLYCHSEAYDTSSERGLNPQDERLAITWPLPITELSARDAAYRLITIEFEGVGL
ncbi:dTDP-4-dehydrorhamnose 3,5-epimerase family protein [Propionivibrio sp.]|uniref:dTDP-4-dehydrorhamnose 3,5-epimerase family protein n=1 Tax=Propionivibrio sp. TaxID=2212460 RepID=UPI0026035A43|nr:dTDP-4-dehydrorhamnose 3,5-epimerase family protein [Propionivibrio sp.]